MQPENGQPAVTHIEPPRFEMVLRIDKPGLGTRILRRPLLTTRNAERAEKSWWVWGAVIDRSGLRYQITLLSILKRLTGFSIWIPIDEITGEFS